MTFKRQFDGDYIYYVSDCRRYWIFKKDRRHWILTERIGSAYPVDRHVTCETLKLAKYLAYARRLYGPEYNG